MRDFSWEYFSKTGDLDAYLLYKQVTGDRDNDSESVQDEPEIEDTLGG